MMLYDEEDTKDSDYVAEFATRRLEVSRALRNAHQELLRAHPERRKRANVTHTILSIMKSFIGAAFLFLPSAFRDGGMLFSNVIMTLSLVINVIGIFRLVDITRIGRESYGDIAEDAMGWRGRALVNFSIWLSQIAFFAVFLIFAATNTADLLESVAGCSIRVYPSHVLFAMVPFQIALSCVRRIKHFGPVIALADLCVVAALVLIYGLVIGKIIKDGPAKVEAFNEKSYPLFLGAAAYAWEGVGMILPVRAAMQEHIKHKFKWLMALTLSVVCLIFLSYSSLSYLAYGAETKTVILSNLEEGVLGFTVQGMYVLSLIGSAPLVIFPALKVVDALMYPDPHAPPSRVRKWVKNFSRALQIFFVAVISVLCLEQLDNFIALIGSFAAVPVAYIYPPLFHLLLAPQASIGTKAVNVGIITLGLALMVFTAYSAIDEWHETETPRRCSN